MKRLLLGGLTIGVLFLIYYFCKPYEYKVHFKAKTMAGDVIETLRIWNKSIEGSSLIEVDSFNRARQTVMLNGSSYVYDWIFWQNDSLTEIRINISQPGHTFLNKILVPFTLQPIEKDAENLATQFFKVLNEHLEITKVEIIGETKLSSSFCFCRNVKTQQTNKAKAMMYEYPLINSVVETIKLDILGEPSIRVLNWNHSKDQLEYNFCFPIELTDSLIQVNGFEYLKFEGGSAIKAVYNGNYITSDRAWYELVHYANRNNYQISGWPIEYFIDNPNYGSNELDWRAEIYLPVKEKQ